MAIVKGAGMVMKAVIEVRVSDTEDTTWMREDTKFLFIEAYFSRQGEKFCVSKRSCNVLFIL